MIPIIFSTMCISILSQGVYEKEIKMKETLKMMSLKTSVYGASFVLAQSILSTFIATIMTALMAVFGILAPSEAENHPVGST